MITMLISRAIKVEFKAIPKFWVTPLMSPSTARWASESAAPADMPEAGASTDEEDGGEGSSSEDNDSSTSREYVSFEEHFSETAKGLYGDMGPEPKDDGRGRRRRRSRR